MNLALFGLTAPFAAALIDRFGITMVTACALTLVEASAAAQTVFMTASWRDLTCSRRVKVGLGTGSMALVSRRRWGGR